MNKVIHGDCIEGMKKFDDDYFAVGFADCPQPWKEDTVIKDGFFPELERVCKDIIVFGYPFYHDYLDNKTGFIIWDKGGFYASQPVDEALIIYTSFESSTRLFRFDPALQVGAVHPSQKPAELYRWILRVHVARLAGDGPILDCHTGSGTLRVECARAGRDYIGFETDDEYYEIQETVFRRAYGMDK